MRFTKATLMAVLVGAPLFASAAVTYTLEEAPNGGAIANAYAVVRSDVVGSESFRA